MTRLASPILRRFAVVAVAVLLALGAQALLTRDERGPGRTGTGNEEDDKWGSPRSNGGKGRKAGGAARLPAALKRSCELPKRWLLAVYRGWDPAPVRAYDLAIVPHPPNYIGSVTDTSHSGPYDFLQDVPIVFYGPGLVSKKGRVTSSPNPTLADIAPTYADLMDFSFASPDGRSLADLFRSDIDPPRLIVTAVIDGGGWNVLKRWRGRWPEMKDLMDKGVVVTNATVGSSPSITPATHTNLSTGAFPRTHGVSAIVVRTESGRLTEAFTPVGKFSGAATMNPTVNLHTRTLADGWDLKQDNRAHIGLLTPGVLQLGMVGKGSALPGADKDIVAALTKRTRWETNPRFYSLPRYVNSEVRGPERDQEEVDRLDGSADGLWRGHSIDRVDSSPGFAAWENRTMKALMDREGFGDDNITDLFYVNYKSPDAAGHLYNMIAPEQGDVIESVDTALGDLARWLDREVGRGHYLLTITADHGQTPLGAGGWPIRPLEIIADLNERFDDTPNGRGVIQDTSAHTLFMNRNELRTNGVTPETVASWLQSYTLQDNVAAGDDYPAEFDGRQDERVFDAVIPGRRITEVARFCGAL